MSKVLIVDDDKSIHITIAGILKKEGHDVDVMDNGFKAIEAVKEKSYDIALMDIRMPGINGVDTFKQIKKISPETTVIMMTAYAYEELKKEALREGAYDILDKPFDMKNVIETLSDIESRNLVVIVDESADFREKVKKNLEEHNFRAVPLSNPEDVLNLVRRKKPDVIILDFKMPGLDGVKTLEKINSLIENPEDRPGVIMVSAFKDEADLEKTGKLGAEFIEKPLDMKKLIEKINLMIQKKTGSSDQKPYNILVVDDEAYFRKMLIEKLTCSGFSVREASSGSRALEIVRNEDCQAVLLDLKLPDISGLEVFRKIQEEKPGVDVIMMTAYASDETLMDEIKKSGYVCLVKPFETSKLMDLINNIMKEKQ